MIKVNTRRFVRCLGVVVLLAAAAACSSNGKHSSSNTVATTAASGGTPSSVAGTGPALKVGVICTCSGLGLESADGADAMDVLRAWAKSVNTSGGLEGHPVDLMFFDDQGNPGRGIADAQTLVGDHVAVIADLSLFPSSWANEVNAAKIPVIGGASEDLEYTTNPDFYSVSETDDTAVYGVVAVAKQAGAANIGAVVCAEAASCAEAIPLVKTAGHQVGVPLVYSAAVSSTAPNYTAQCVAAKQKSVKALWPALPTTTAISLATDCNQQDYDPIYAAEGSTYSSQIDSSPTINKNFWLAFGGLPLFADTPAVQAMNTAVDHYYPGLRKGTSWVESAAQSWADGLLIRDVVKGSGVGAADTITAATMTQGLGTIKNDTLDGWSAPLTFVAGKPHLLDCWFAAKIVNGTRSVLNNGQPTCRPGGTS